MAECRQGELSERPRDWARAAAQYRRAAALWKDADPALAPFVAAARAGAVRTEPPP